MEESTPVKLEQVVDLNLLYKHVAEGLVSNTYHSTLPLAILNYTHLAQRTPGLWGDGTIDWCRGLIVDLRNRNVIARPFKKFHNLNTPSIPETLEANLPKTTPTILEKLDGSLGILWRFENEWGIATRGSFTSPQAIWATNWLKERVSDVSCSLDFSNLYTPLFEILYAENRIVCRYNYDHLELLALIVNGTGEEVPHNVVSLIGERKGYRVVQQHPKKNIYDCLIENEENREGYVVSYPVGAGKPPVKVKIKFADYVRLHKIVTGMNPRSVWELLSAGKDLADLEAMDLPEHFKTWLYGWRDSLTKQFDEIYIEAGASYLGRPIFSGGDARRYRGEFAAYVKQFDPMLQGVLFTMLDGADPTPIIWKQLKPRGDDKSYRTEGE